MSLITSLQPNANVSIIGSSGAIGRALVDQLETDDRVSVINAFSRDSETRIQGKVRHHFLDLSDEPSIREAAAFASADGPIDLAVVATGILHRDNRLQPEKSMRELDPGSLALVIAVNAIGPGIVAKHFLPAMRRGHKTVFAALSARVGSIGDNRLGGWTSYRASKAALNMILKNLAIEQAQRSRGSIVVGLHPGTVDSDLSKPFTGRVAAGQLFSPATAATHLLSVVDGLNTEDSGGFFAWDGQPICF